MNDLLHMLTSMSASEWWLIGYVAGMYAALARMLYVMATDAEILDVPLPVFALISAGVCLFWPLALFVCVCDVIANGPGDDPPRRRIRAVDAQAMVLA